MISFAQKNATARAYESLKIGINNLHGYSNSKSVQTKITETPSLSFLSMEFARTVQMIMND